MGWACIGGLISTTGKAALPVPKRVNLSENFQIAMNLSVFSLSSQTEIYIYAQNCATWFFCSEKTHHGFRNFLFFKSSSVLEREGFIVITGSIFNHQHGNKGMDFAKYMGKLGQK